MSFSKDLRLGMRKSRRRQMPICNTLPAKVFELCVSHTECLTVSIVRGSSFCSATDLRFPLTDSVYEQWQKQYHEASVALENREDRIETVSASIERDLVLLGATAIEDKLQDGVPETIADLKRAGIKVWVATGDKLETAVAIGYTTNLLTKDSNMIIVREGRHEIYDQLKNAIEGFFGEDVREMDNQGNLQPIDDAGGHELRRLDTGVTSLVGRDNGTRSGGYSLVIDGGALRHVSARSHLQALEQLLIRTALHQAFADPATEELLLHLSTQCNTVVCCRVSPLQKAQIVRLIKDNLGVMCLAIGDGANDVSMIQAADIGVGISGEEGLQAVNSSDYAIAQVSCAALSRCTDVKTDLCP